MMAGMMMALGSSPLILIGTLMLSLHAIDIRDMAALTGCS
jgi:hypothetical protein